MGQSPPLLTFQVQYVLENHPPNILFYPYWCCWPRALLMQNYRPFVSQWSSPSNVITIQDNGIHYLLSDYDVVFRSMNMTARVIRNERTKAFLMSVSCETFHMFDLLCPIGRHSMDVPVHLMAVCEGGRSINTISRGWLWRWCCWFGKRIEKGAPSLGDLELFFILESCVVSVCFGSQSVVIESPTFTLSGNIYGSWKQNLFPSPI